MKRAVYQCLKYTIKLSVRHVKIEAINLEGQSFELEADELLAVCIQHEMDHLNGKLFVDYLSPLKRQRAREKVEKWCVSAKRKVAVKR